MYSDKRWEKTIQNKSYIRWEKKEGSKMDEKNKRLRRESGGEEGEREWESMKNIREIL